MPGAAATPALGRLGDDATLRPGRCRVTRLQLREPHARRVQRQADRPRHETV